MSMGDGKAKNVVEYLDNLIEKGKATPGAIRPLKVAFTKVVQVIDADTWENTDVRSINIDDYMARFANLTMGKYTTESLTAYKSRMNRAVSWYIQFLDKPGWTPDVQNRNRAAKSELKKHKPITKGKNISVSSAQTHTAEAPLPVTPSIATMPDRILYPYPLSNGQLVHVSLPLKFSKTDAKRLGVFIESIAIDDLAGNGASNG